MLLFKYHVIIKYIWFDLSETLLEVGQKKNEETVQLLHYIPVEEK